MGILDIFRGRAPLCPRDGARLSRVSRNGSHLDRCPSCRGLWIEAGQMRRIADGRELAKADAWVGHYPTPSGFACPSCGGSCAGTYLEEFSVHTCVACHGVWIDSHEVTSAKGSVTVRSTQSGPELRAFLARL